MNVLELILEVKGERDFLWSDGTFYRCADLNDLDKEFIDLFFNGSETKSTLRKLISKLGQMKRLAK